MTGTSPRAASFAATLGLLQVGLAELVGITRFRQGFCCGFERDALPTFANVVWFAAVAVAVGAMLAVPLAERAVVPFAARAVVPFAALAGAAVAAPLMAFIVSLSPDPGDGDLTVGRVLGAYGIGLALGLVAALLVTLTPAYDTVVPLGLCAVTAAYWITDLAALIGNAPIRLGPGGFGFGGARPSIALVPLFLVAVLAGLLDAVLVSRLARSTWRRVGWWLTFVGGLVLSAAVVRGLSELAYLAGRGLAQVAPAGNGFGGAGLLYAMISLGAALALRRPAGARWWLGASVAAGLALIIGALLLTEVFGPRLSGDGALGVDGWDIAVALVAAFAAGALAATRATRDPTP